MRHVLPANPSQTQQQVRRPALFTDVLQLCHWVISFSSRCDGLQCHKHLTKGVPVCVCQELSSRCDGLQ